MNSRFQQRFNPLGLQLNSTQQINTFTHEQAIIPSVHDPLIENETNENWTQDLMTFFNANKHVLSDQSDSSPSDSDDSSHFGWDSRASFDDDIRIRKERWLRKVHAPPKPAIKLPQDDPENIAAESICSLFQEEETPHGYAPYIKKKRSPQKSKARESVLAVLNKNPPRIQAAPEPMDFPPQKLAVKTPSPPSSPAPPSSPTPPSSAPSPSSTETMQLPSPQLPQPSLNPEASDFQPSSKNQIVPLMRIIFPPDDLLSIIHHLRQKRQIRHRRGHVINSIYTSKVAPLMSIRFSIAQTYRMEMARHHARLMSAFGYMCVCQNFHYPLFTSNQSCFCNFI